MSSPPRKHEQGLGEIRLRVNFFRKTTHLKAEVTRSTQNRTGAEKELGSPSTPNVAVMRETGLASVF